MNNHQSRTLLTPPGQPYSVAELNAQYASTPPRAAYLLICKRCGCKPIPAVAEMFPDRIGSWGDVAKVDVSKTYVGPKGIVPVIEMCKLLPNVESFVASDNYLTNESIWTLCKMALFHPTLSTIDVSKNPFSWTGAMCLIELVTKNLHIGTMALMGTSIPQGIADAIMAQVLKNASLGSRRYRSGLNPCNHPTTIRQRALKRYFQEICASNGSCSRTAGGASELTVPREMLSSGLKEMWKVSGREREITQRTPLFYENFNKRASQDAVGWEEFLILIMIEDVLYNPTFVERLRTVFTQFDVDGGGYVEVRELKSIMTQLSLSHTPPTVEELQAKMGFYDLHESMTLTWDEFLLLLYDHGPVVGSKAELLFTPLPPFQAAHHN